MEGDPTPIPRTGAIHKTRTPPPVSAPGEAGRDVDPRDRRRRGSRRIVVPLPASPTAADGRGGGVALLDTRCVDGTIARVGRRVALIGALALVASRAAAAEAPAKPTLAILFFDYTGKDAGLEPLREGLAQMLISDFSTAPQVRVVERARLEALLEEQKLGQSGKVDAASASRVGKLLGARFLVLGSFFDLKSTLRIDARVVEVETGRIVRSAGATGPADDFWTLEQQLAQKLGEILKSALPEFASAPRPAPPAKVKSQTIATYGRALSALDRGHKAEAKKLLEEVVTEAPQFGLAKTDLNALLQ